MEEEENLVFSGRYSGGSNNGMETPSPEEVGEAEANAAPVTIASQDDLEVETALLKLNDDDLIEEEPEVAENDVSSLRTSKKSREDEEIEQLGGALVWPTESNNRPPGYFCYTSEQWNGLKDKKLFYTGKLTLISKILWINSYDDAYRMAIYQRPTIILILKQQPPSLFGGNRQPTILTVESILDPAVCKLKLSHWTTPSSIYHSKQPQLGLHESCFELVSPTHTWTFSVLPPLILKNIMPPSDHHSSVLGKSDQDRWIRDTFMWEAMLSQALLQLHVATVTATAPQALVSPNKIIKDCYSWRHAVILGTLHSYVVTSDKEMLRAALSQTPKVNINEIDEYGFTPLHYACNQRDTSAVRLLVKAGADPTIPLVNKEYLLSSTCFHISAANLDCKTLSILLSSTQEPNVSDEYGRTPMYIAAVEGITVDPNNPQANLTCLDSTLRTLQKCGGHYMIGDPSISTSSVRHPVCTLSHRWEATKLSIVLSHDTHTPSISLGTLYQYPLHVALISLRQTISEELNSLLISNITPQQEQSNNIVPSPSKNQFSIAATSPRAEEENVNKSLSGTLRVLLNHGLEPNERCYFLSMDDELYLQYHGCTPIQILAICALDVSSIIHRSTMTESQNRLADSLLEQIAFAAEVLTYCGARIQSIIDPPPQQQPIRQVAPATREPDSISLLWKTLAEFNNEHFWNLMGSKERLSAAWTSWSIKGSIPAPSVFELRCKPTSDDSTASFCTICWKPFGKIRSRKHWCRSSHCYVCDDCSSKRVFKFGEELRVSDGQYLLASFLNAQQSSVDASQVESNKNTSTASLSSAKSRKSSSLRSSSAEEIEEEREELFSGFTAMGRTMMNYLTGIDKAEEGTTMSGLAETLGQTKDALLERGTKLSSLSEKTSALADSSREFAALAKALKESQQKANSGFFW